MPWSVAQTKPNASALACANLRRQGFAYYNPRVNERVKLMRRGVCCGRSWRRTQLFANYIFVEADQHWRAIKSTVGISGLILPSCEHVANLLVELIDSLKRREDPKTGLVIFNKSKFEVGDKVQLRRGAFALETGLFDGQRDQDRVFVLLSLLGSQRRVEVTEDNLVAA